jgi:hypothetical protein
MRHGIDDHSEVPFGLGLVRHELLRQCFRQAASIAMWGSHIFSGWGLFAMICFHQALNSWSMTSKVCPDIGKAGSASASGG